MPKNSNNRNGFAGLSVRPLQKCKKITLLLLQSCQRFNTRQQKSNHSGTLSGPYGVTTSRFHVCMRVLQFPDMHARCMSGMSRWPYCRVVFFCRVSGTVQTVVLEDVGHAVTDYRSCHVMCVTVYATFICALHAMRFYMRCSVLATRSDARRLLGLLPWQPVFALGDLYN